MLSFVKNAKIILLNITIPFIIRNFIVNGIIIVKKYCVFFSFVMSDNNITKATNSSTGQTNSKGHV